MLKNIAKALVFSIVLFSISMVSALELSGDITLKEASSNSLTLSWDEVEGALCYSIYYDTKPVDDGLYSKEELCVGNEYTIEGLDAGTEYFLSVSIASQDMSEGGLSKEVSFKTIGDGSLSTDPLKLNEVVAEYKKQLKLSFNLALSKSGPREFRIVDKDDSLVELDIESSEISGTNDIIITLVDDLSIDTEYNLTVISLSGENGENIELGVDGIASFLTPSNLQYKVNEEEVTIIVDEPVKTETIVEDDVSLNSGIENNAPGGSDISDNELNKSTIMAKENAEGLPATGPEHILLIVLALLVSFFVIKSRARSNS